MNIKQNKKNKLLLIFSLIAIFFLLIFFLSGPLLNGIIKPKLLESLNENNKNLNLSVENLNYNLFNNCFSLKENKLIYIDSSSNSIDSFLIKIPLVKIGGINWLGYIFNGNIKINNIIIDKPLINIFETNTKNANDSASNKKSFSLTSSKIFPFNCNELTINSGRFIRKNSDHQTIDSIKNFNIQIDGINIDSTKNKRSDLVESLSLKLGGIYKLFTDDGYKLKIDSVSVSSYESSFQIDSIDFKPYISEEEFFKRKEYRNDRYIINIKNITGKNFTIDSLINNGNVFSDEIKIEDFYVNILTPKFKPADPNYNPKMPNEIFRSLKEKINIKKLLVSKGELVIESKYGYSTTPAKISFTNTKAEIKNISNLKSIQTENNPCKIIASANLNGAGKLSVNMNLPLLSKNFSLNYYGNLESMDAVKLNSQLITAELVKINSGKIDTITFDVNIKDKLASAKVKAIYKNLKIENIKKESLNGKVEKSSIKSFLSSIALRKSNPNEEGEEKIGRYIYYKKNDDAFMDIIWGSVKGALGDIVGY